MDRVVPGDDLSAASAEQVSDSAALADNTPGTIRRHRRFALSFAQQGVEKGNASAARPVANRHCARPSAHETNAKNTGGPRRISELGVARACKAPRHRQL